MTFRRLLKKVITSGKNRKSLPAFPIKSRNNTCPISILQQPKDFYERIRNGITSSTRRVVLCSLYLGDDQSSVCIAEDLVKAASSHCNSVKVLVDGNRGTRGKHSSKDLLLPLVQAGGKVSMYHTPDLDGLRATLIPRPFNEIFGLMHMKFFVFDDTLVLSGATLALQYYTCRQDRYIVFENQPELCNFFEDLATAISDSSHFLSSENELILKRDLNNVEVRRHLTASRVHEVIDMYSNNGEVESYEKAETLIFPLIQMAPLNIFHDREVTLELLSFFEEDSKLQLTSGYFNLTNNYADAIINGKSSVQILNAAPRANGFFAARFPLGSVPRVYSHLASEFLRRVEDSNNTERIVLKEYSRQNWTYHAKGLWYTPKDEEHLGPTLTLIGSPNFGHRSDSRDLEAQVAIVTQNPELRKAFACERDSLFQYGSEISRDYLEKSVDHRAGSIEKLAANWQHLQFVRQQGSHEGAPRHRSSVDKTKPLSPRFN
eukprot:UC4_evm2s655